MLVEGMNLQMKTSRKTLQYFGWYYKHIVWLNYSVGWLFPFLIVVPAALAGFLTDSYMEKNDSRPTLFPNNNYELCWLNSESLMRVYAVILPIGMIILLNMIFVFRSMLFVIRIKKKELELYSIQERQQEAKNYSQLQHSLKVVLLLIPVTGVPWILLFLSSKYNVF